MSSPTVSLPAKVDQVLKQFVEASRTACGDSLASVVLFGSAAEGRMRPTSDVNVIVVLTEFVPERMAALSPALELARAAIRLEAMFVLSAEILAAVECFAQKFADILRRRLVLYGADPFGDVLVPRTAELFRLRQVLLNLILRLRTSYAEHLRRPDQMAAIIADASGPLRSCAANLLALEAGSPPPPKEALQRVIETSGNDAWKDALADISALREQRPPSRQPAETMLAVLDIAGHLRRRAEELR